MTTREQAEQDLRDWAATNARRDDLVRAARLAGVSKNRIHTLTGIARTTIDRIVAKESTVATKTYQAQTIATGTTQHGEPAEIVLTCNCKRHRSPASTGRCLRRQREEIVGYSIQAATVTQAAVAADGARIER